MLNIKTSNDASISPFETRGEGQSQKLKNDDHCGTLINYSHLEIKDEQDESEEETEEAANKSQKIELAR